MTSRFRSDARTPRGRWPTALPVGVVVTPPEHAIQAAPAVSVSSSADVAQGFSPAVPWLSGPEDSWL